MKNKHYILQKKTGLEKSVLHKIIFKKNMNVLKRFFLFFPIIVLQNDDKVDFIKVSFSLNIDINLKINNNTYENLKIKKNIKYANNR